MKLFKNKKADGTDYFAALEEMSAIAAEEAALLKQIFADYKSEQLETYRKEMHALEHRCDTVKHNMVTALKKEFLPPVNREDLFRLAHLADDFTDAIESVVAFLYMANVSSLKEDTPAFAELISDSAQTVVELFKEFRNFKKSLNELKNVVVKLNDLEEQGDRLYLEAMRKLAKEASDTRELIEWRSVYSSLERCMDAAESIADDIELVVMKNI